MNRRRFFALIAAAAGTAATTAAGASLDALTSARCGGVFARGTRVRVAMRIDAPMVRKSADKGMTMVFHMPSRTTTVHMTDDAGSMATFTNPTTEQLDNALRGLSVQSWDVEVRL